MRSHRIDGELSLKDGAIFRRGASRNAASDQFAGHSHTQWQRPPLSEFPDNNGRVEHQKHRRIRCTLCKHLNIIAETCLHPPPLPTRDEFFTWRGVRRRTSKVHSNDESTKDGIAVSKARTGQQLHLDQSSQPSTDTQQYPLTLSFQGFPWPRASSRHDHRVRNSYDSSR